MRSRVPFLTLSYLVVSTMAAPLLPENASAQEGPEVGARYEALSAAGDHAGLVELWRANPESAIPVIDGDLEGSLALWEDDPQANRDEIQRLLERAVAGAHAAVEGTERRRILDYVTSFAGWNDDQKGAFRAGQRAFRSGRQALRDGDANEALRLGRECHALAEPLGDWWGTAMGLGLAGSALSALGEPAEAATAMARARLIYRELGLTSSALRIEADLAELLLALDRRPRAEALISDGQATAERLGLDELRDRFAAMALAVEGGS